MSVLKKLLSVLLLICLLAALPGCAGGAAGSPLPGEPAEEPEVSPEETPEPLTVTGAELDFPLPRMRDGLYDVLPYYAVPEEEDCFFLYPDFCDFRRTEGAEFRLDPVNWFARIFLTVTDRSAPDAPDRLLGLLDPGKWQSAAGRVTVGERYEALRMSVTVYDTYRRWIAWETDSHYYLLYGVCFDRREDDLNAVLQTIADSFWAASDLCAELPEDGMTLAQGGGLSVVCTKALLRPDWNGLQLELCLDAVNSSDGTLTLSVDGLYAGAETLPMSAVCRLGPSEGASWAVNVFVEAAEDGSYPDELSFAIAVRSADASEAYPDLPVRILLTEQES